MITTAFVNIWNHRVGAIAWNHESRLGSFEYDLAFLDHRLDIAPLMMPLKDARGKVFSFQDLRDSNTFKGLPGLLADAIPDKFGNALINAWLTRNGRPSNSMNPIEMLCFIGKRGMGALEFEPVNPVSDGGATKIELEDLINVAQEILSGRAALKTSLAEGKEKALHDILKIGSSAGGARAKAMIAYNPITREVRSGQSEAPYGFSHWLIKFDGVSDAQSGINFGYGSVEMAYFLMAKEAGIDMMECKLLEENGRAHFMTKRFDRETNDVKLHVQSLCAMAHFDFNDILSYSYEQLFEVMRKLMLPYAQAEQMFRRMVFNVMSRNCDDHTKNFAFIMDKAGTWKLAPAFDVCHSYRPDSTWVSQHSLSLNGRRKDIARQDFMEVAQRMNIKKAANLIDEVGAAVKNWQTFADQAKVKPALTDEIASTLLIL
jgi:serine/threonine-protein kinase HipA